MATAAAINLARLFAWCQGLPALRPATPDSPRWSLHGIRQRHRISAYPVDRWASAAGLTSGLVVRRFRKGGWLVYETSSDGVAGTSAGAIAHVVALYARPFGWDLSLHDLRRTFAKLAWGGQAPLEQIQLALGHQNIQATQRYLGSELDLVDAACDRLGIRLQ